jgi:hypothetical protein
MPISTESMETLQMVVTARAMKLGGNIEGLAVLAYGGWEVDAIYDARVLEYYRFLCILRYGAK